MTTTVCKHPRTVETICCFRGEYCPILVWRRRKNFYYSLICKFDVTFSIVMNLLCQFFFIYFICLFIFCFMIHQMFQLSRGLECKWVSSAKRGQTDKNRSAFPNEQLFLNLFMQLSDPQCDCFSNSPEYSPFLTYLEKISKYKKLFCRCIRNYFRPLIYTVVLEYTANVLLYCKTIFL